MSRYMEVLLISTMLGTTALYNSGCSGCAPKGGAPISTAHTILKATPTPAPSPTPSPSPSPTPTVAPSAPVIVSPATSPYDSSSSSLALAGTCSAGDTVNLSGADTQSATCASNGTFTFAIAKSVDGAYTFSVTQTNPVSALTSASASIQWVRDTVAPSGPTVTTPASNPYISNGNSVTLSGACETGATVSLGGASTQSTTCSSAAYSFTVNENADATYAFTLSQTDAAGNVSPTTSFSWQRDTVAPATPTITNPNSSPFTSGDTNLSINGGCETGATVLLSGSSVQSVSCVSSAYSFTVTETVDATYSFSIAQRDAAGNTSGSVSQTWIRNTSVPPTPTVTAPTSNPFYTSGNSVTLSGGCVTGYTVNLTGADTLSATCASSSYSFSLSRTVDGTYSYSVSQTNTSNGLTSATVSFSWVRDTVAPAVPTIASPTGPTVINNASTLSVSGGCEPFASVLLDGSATQTATCSSGGAYSFTVSENTDAVYSFTVTQTDRAGNVSPSASLQWTRDTQAPAAPVIVNPSSNPLVSGDTTILIEGTCETGATVNLSGDSTQSMACASSAFSFSVTETVDGTYNFSVAQTDAAGNVSPSTAQQWVRDTTIPPTPTLTSPTGNPYYSNGSSITVAGGCVSGDLVSLSGDSVQSMTCTTSNTYSFSVTVAADATYNFYVNQENTTTGSVSSQISQQWVRDTVAPAALALISPASSPYTSSGNLLIQGTCEPNATVNLTGAGTLSAACSSSGTFSLTVVESVDATYTMSLTQSDQAGNVSVATSLQWVRNSTIPATPTIASPVYNPYYSNGSSIALSGGCTTGLTVTLGGGVVASDVTSPAGSLTQTCSNGAYSFTIAKTVDGTYTFNVTQTNGANTSGAASLQWVRSTSAPTVTLTSSPSGTNLSVTASFNFSANKTVTYKCRLDGISWNSCTPIVTYSNLANASHTFEVQATDQAGNLSSVVSYAWTQAAYKTVALYHLDDSAPNADSSLYTSPNNNAITTSSGITSATGVFAQGRYFGGVGLMSAPDSGSFGAISAQLTVETRIKVNTVPNSGFNVIAGQQAATAGNYGWELRLHKGPSGKVKFGLYCSTGTAAGTEIISSGVAFSTTTFYHLAATYNAGAVKIYFNGSQIGSGTVTSKALNNSSTAFRMGQDSAGASKLDATLDEVRVSQILRYSAPFSSSIPASAFTAD